MNRALDVLAVLPDRSSTGRSLAGVAANVCRHGAQLSFKIWGFRSTALDALRALLGTGCAHAGVLLAVLEDSLLHSLLLYTSVILVLLLTLINAILGSLNCTSLQILRHDSSSA